MEETSKSIKQEISLAQTKKQEFENLISRLYAKQSQLDAKKELAILTDGINIKKFRENHFIKISQILRRLEKRQEKAERLLDGLIGLKYQPGQIDYGKKSSDAMEEIESLLHSNS
jgi:hypothetical protein